MTRFEGNGEPTPAHRCMRVAGLLVRASLLEMNGQFAMAEFARLTAERIVDDLVRTTLVAEGGRRLV